MKPLSLTARISLLFAVAVAVVLLATGYLISRAVEHHFAVEDKQEMLRKLELVRHVLAKPRNQVDQDALAGELDDALVGHEGLSVAVIDSHGHIWFATSGSAFPNYLLETKGIRPGSLQHWVTKEGAYRGILVPVMVDGRVFKVAISVDIDHHLVFMVKFRRILAMAMVFAALVTAGLGWAVTSRGLQPLREINRLAASVSADRLSERLPESNVPTEIRAVAETFNAMLNRLEDAFKRLTDFSSDIAHELRTPISNLMTQTQVALSKTRNADEYREVLESSMEEYERLARMIGDMLFLAQADNHMIVPRREAVDLAAEVSRLFDYYDVLAAEREIHLTLDGGAQVMGDRLMLQRVISNLLSNALRYTLSGGTVNVRLESLPGECRLILSNPGADIPPEQLARLFDRFYRADPARREGSGMHTGLGLAITKSLVEAHGGAIRVASGRGMTRFEVVLPA